MTSTPTLHTPRTTTAPVARSDRGAAFFDLDGTLIPGSANIPPAKAAFREGFVTPLELLLDLRNGLSFLLKGATDERSAQVRDRILRAVSGRPAEQVEALGDQFMTELVGTLQPVMGAELRKHEAAGRHRIVLSASPTEIVSRFAHEAGLELGTGTTSERDAEGRYTGRLSGPFCYREGKVEVMRRLADRHGYDLAKSYAYSDSISDLPMLEAVGHPVAVNPEPELRALAGARNWPIIGTSSLPRVSLTSLPGLGRLAAKMATLPATALQRVIPRPVDA